MSDIAKRAAEKIANVSPVFRLIQPVAEQIIAEAEAELRAENERLRRLLRVAELQLQGPAYDWWRKEAAALTKELGEQS